MDILRFITAGSVDDGKSTLIGRLLYDTNNIKSDVLESVADNSSVVSSINLAHITDGLRSERAQGITIDVAYKYFTTKNRKYIISDAPGHSHYTKNLVTGASGADAIIILIDAQNGITRQTRIHSMVASFLKIQQVVVAVNKMDLVNYDEQVFSNIRNEYIDIAEKLQLQNLTFIPVSALAGDNVTTVSQNMGWYKGETLMQYLENCAPAMNSFDAVRFSVQYVVDGAEKGYLGKMLSGNLKTGDAVTIYPNKQASVVSKILCGYSEVSEATAGQNIHLCLDNNPDVQRGDIISDAGNSIICSDEFDANICWLDAGHPIQTGIEYYLRINTTEVICTITEVLYKVNAGTFEQYKDNTPLEVNGFAKVRIKTKSNIAFDRYSILPENGRGVLINTETNYTCAAFTIENEP